MVQLNLRALTSTIAAAVSAAVKDAMATQHQLEHLVDEEISHFTHPTGTLGVDPPISTLSAGDAPRQLFTSIGVNWC